MEILLVFLGIALFFIVGMGFLASVADTSRSSNFVPMVSPLSLDEEPGYWISPSTFFAQAIDEDGIHIWRMHTDGNLTVYKAENKKSKYKYEVMQNKAINCDVPVDTIFFSHGKHLWLGNYRLNRYERFSKEYRVWCCMDEFNFKEALKAKNEQRS